MRNIILALIISFFSLQVVATDQVTSSNKIGHTEVENYVEKLINDATLILDDTKLNLDAKVAKCRDLFKNNLDFPFMAAYTLGRNKKSISDDDYQNFIQAYSSYVTRSYVDLIKNYNHEKVVIEQVINLPKDKDTDQYVVVTKIVKGNGGTIKAAYLVGGANGKYKVRDIKTEGVGMIDSQKAEFASKIAHDGFSALLSKLKEKKSRAE